jgi:branched-chain amino acid transport system permease protein
MDTIILQALNGTSMGALLFLLASGFTLTFGLGRVVNLAHGAFYLLGGYLGLSTLRASGSFWLALVTGGLAIVVTSWICDRLLIRRTRDHVFGQILLTVGIAYVLADLCLAVWGGNPLRLPPPEFARGPIDLPGGIVYPRYRFFLIVLGVAVAAVLWLLHERTPLGALVRAGVDDREMVAALGIDVHRLFALVFGLAAFLAGLSGVVGGAFLTLYPGADWEILAYALVVVIVGGLGSLPGAMVGSLIVGLVDAYGRWLLPEFSYFMVFGPMAVLLMVRPTGLFGREA